MATRFYLPSSSGTPSISPTTDSWPGGNGSNFVRLTNSIVNSGSTLTTQSETTGAAGSVCYKQFVSPPLLGAQSVTGTVSWAVWGTDSAADTASVVDIRVIQSDGTTVRGVALTRTVGSGNFTSAGRTDFANAIAITTVSAQHGDFIVIEMGAKSLTSNNRTPILTFGGSGGSDYGYTATDTTSGKNPSVQLSATLAFQVGANSLMLMGCGT